MQQGDALGDEAFYCSLLMVAVKGTHPYPNWQSFRSQVTVEPIPDDPRTHGAAIEAI
jgi:hypothetical protein